MTQFPKQLLIEQPSNRKMNKRKNKLLSLVLLSPFSALAHGEEVLVTLYIDLFSFVALLLYIGFLKWHMKGKFLLLFFLILAEFINFILFANIPYQRNDLLINAMSFILPCSFVLGASLLFRRKFSKNQP